MKRIRPLGVLILAGALISFSVLGVGIYKLWNIDHTIDSGVKEFYTLLDSASLPTLATGEDTEANAGVHVSNQVPGTQLIVDGLPALGVLTFDKQQRSVVVYDGTTVNMLAKGAGHADGTAALNTIGNAVVHGHRDAAFRSMASLKVGDTVTVRDTIRTVTYTVTEIFVTSPNDERMYENTDKMEITLVTCYPFVFVGSAPDRCVIRAVAAS